jgi:hypothetical protein
MSKYAARVATGAALLDEHGNGNGWRRDINKGTLNINDFYLCVLAQLFGNYSAGLQELGLFTTSEAIEHGFDVEMGVDDSDELTSAWLDIL